MEEDADSPSDSTTEDADASDDSPEQAAPPATGCRLVQELAGLASSSLQPAATSRRPGSRLQDRRTGLTQQHAGNAPKQPAKRPAAPARPAVHAAQLRRQQLAVRQAPAHPQGRAHKQQSAAEAHAGPGARPVSAAATRAEAQKRAREAGTAAQPASKKQRAPQAADIDPELLLPVSPAIAETAKLRRQAVAEQAQKAAAQPAAQQPAPAKAAPTKAARQAGIFSNRQRSEAVPVPEVPAPPHLGGRPKAAVKAAVKQPPRPPEQAVSRWSKLQRLLAQIGLRAPEAKIKAHRQSRQLRSQRPARPA